MKEKIHPQLHEAKVICACGMQFTTLSIKKEIKVEICSNCHPFYTGEQRLIDSAGRVEKFNRKYGKKTSSK